MSEDILGIHHVTALASDPRTNLDFYTGVLGLRLVKRTVNFDDPGTYHFYYGDGIGRPGTILTFFPWPRARRGSRGAGQATTTSFSVPDGAIGYWSERLAREGVVLEEPRRRFDEEALVFLDPDGLRLELVAHSGAAGLPPPAGGPIPERHALRGFHSVTLTVGALEPTEELLVEGLGFRPAGVERGRRRYETGAPGGLATRVDVLTTGESRGRIAAGTVHHVAWRVAGDEEHRRWRQRVAGRGLQVTEIIDRTYFHSIYFREPGGVLFEIATDPPGFTVDESPEELGTKLRLPPWLEPQRRSIEAGLPPLETAGASWRDA